MARGAYGRNLAGIFGLDAAPSLVSRRLSHSAAAVTEIICDVANNGLTRALPRQQAFLLTLQLRDCPLHDLWIDGRPMPTGHLSAGTVCLYDLRTDPRVNSVSPFHNLHFFYSRSALTSAADGQDLSRLDVLAHNPGTGMADPTIYALGKSLLPALERPAAASVLFVEHVITAIAAQLVRRFA